MNDLQKLQLYCIASAAFSPSYAYALVLLASAEKAVWSQEETPALVHYLYKHRSQAGNRANFKAATFEAAADAISHLLEDGPEKTGEMCKTKWSRVSDFLYGLSFLATRKPTHIFRSRLYTTASRNIGHRECTGGL